jgi:hypothetical protein
LKNIKSLERMMEIKKLETNLILPAGNKNKIKAKKCNKIKKWKKKYKKIK